MVVTSQADESVLVQTPEQAVCEVAERKARAVQVSLSKPLKSGKIYLQPDDVILAADTVVVSPDGELLGKPANREVAKAMLRLLSDREHRVVSGICLIRGETVVTASETTYVKFAPLSEQIIEAYTASGECDDKAGAYGIQDTASLWIEGIRGDYFNVVGLPLHRLECLLKENFSLSLQDFKEEK
jgi:septum formation protein